MERKECKSSAGEDKDQQAACRKAFKACLLAGQSEDPMMKPSGMPRPSRGSRKPRPTNFVSS